MLNMRLIEDTIKLVVDYLEAEHLTVDSDSIRTSAINWYSNTEITDAEMLASAVLTSSCTPIVIATITWEDLLNWKEFYFPSIPLEYTEIHIHEIQGAMQDELYW